MDVLDKYTKVPNTVIETMSILSGSTFKVLLWIVRQTVGYGKKSDGISISQLSKHTGVSPRQINNSINELKELKFISIIHQKSNDGGNSYNRYSINLKAITTHMQKVHKGNAENAQGPMQKVHTQKTIIQKKREKDFFSFSEETVEAYINYLLNTENVKNKTAYSVKIKKQIRANDMATVEALKKWLPLHKAEMFYKRYKHQDMEIHIKDGETLKGELSSIEFRDQKYIARIYDPETYKSHSIKFNQLEEIESLIKGEK